MHVCYYHCSAHPRPSRRTPGQFAACTKGQPGTGKRRGTVSLRTVRSQNQIGTLH
jgi:hypothetical protein